MTNYVAVLKEAFAVDHGTHWRVHGFVYGDIGGIGGQPRWEDGYMIHTSAVVSLEDDRLITKNNVYLIASWRNETCEKDARIYATREWDFP